MKKHKRKRKDRRLQVLVAMLLIILAGAFATIFWNRANYNYSLDLTRTEISKHVITPLYTFPTPTQEIQTTITPP